MSQTSSPFWVQEQVAELEALLERKFEPQDLGCLDINEAAHTMTVARDPLLSEIRTAENERNRSVGSNPELR
ncbi:MAG TPA: hypothetical protein VLJ39_10560 [Tepidisphaeraceae bacterium]|nr:hypothetical protein [Tepidisphaeraceae bacterium]